MTCNYLKEDYAGVCTASPSPFVPSIAELEQFCFCERFMECPVYLREERVAPLAPEHVPRRPETGNITALSRHTV